MALAGVVGGLGATNEMSKAGECGWMISVSKLNSTKSVSVTLNARSH